MLVAVTGTWCLDALGVLNMAEQSATSMRPVSSETLASARLMAASGTVWALPMWPSLAATRADVSWGAWLCQHLEILFTHYTFA